MRIKIRGAFDFFILGAVILLSIFGIIFVYSAGINQEGILTSTVYKKQIVWVILGLLLMIGTALIDYRSLQRYASYGYIGLIALLILTLLLPEYKNVHSWIRIGPISLQPSEFGKIIYILFLAWYLDRSKNQVPIKRFLIAMGTFGLAAGLILIQPDLGTASVYIPVFLIMCVMGGIPIRYIMIILLTGALTVVFTVLPDWYEKIWLIRHPNQEIKIITVLKNIKLLLIPVIIFFGIAVFSLVGYILLQNRIFHWIAWAFGILAFTLLLGFVAQHKLDIYQKMRLIIFLDPSVDRKKYGWNIWQSLLAIGSGKFWGRGFMMGKQSHLQYLPEQSTDFIFSIFAEETGFIGGLIVFALFMIIFLRLLRIMQTSTNTFGLYIVAGVLAMLVFHFIVNVGMVMSVMPITGIPLPFMSYGGSSYMTFSIALGLAMSVRSRRLDFNTVV